MRSNLCGVFLVAFELSSMGGYRSGRESFGEFAYQAHRVLLTADSLDVFACPLRAFD